MISIGQFVVSKVLSLPSLPTGSNLIGKVQLAGSTEAIGTVKLDPNGNGVKVTEFTTPLPAGTNEIGKVFVSNASVPVSASAPLPVREVYSAYQFLEISATTASDVSASFSSACSQVMLIASADCRVGFDGGSTATGIKLLKGEAVTLPLKATSVSVRASVDSVNLRVIGLR